jgi:hypothetical protein
MQKVNQMRIVDPQSEQLQRHANAVFKLCFFLFDFKDLLALAGKRVTKSIAANKRIRYRIGMHSIEYLLCNPGY